MVDSTLPNSTRGRHRRVGAAVFAAVIAVSAYACAVGLITGGRRLFHLIYLAVGALLIWLGRGGGPDLRHLIDRRPGVSHC